MRADTVDSIIIHRRLNSKSFAEQVVVPPPKKSNRLDRKRPSSRRASEDACAPVGTISNRMNLRDSQAFAFVRYSTRPEGA